MWYNLLMAKKKITSKSKIKPSSLRIVTVLSLAINVVALIVLITGAVFEKAGTFNYAIVNDGISTMCSTQFRQTVESNSKKQGKTDRQVKYDLALIDYPCSHNGASKYYQDGFKDYAASIGAKQ